GGRLALAAGRPPAPGRQAHRLPGPPRRRARGAPAAPGAVLAASAAPDARAGRLAHALGDALGYDVGASSSASRVWRACASRRPSATCSAALSPTTTQTRSARVIAV